MPASRCPGQEPRDQNQHRNRCSLQQELRRLPLEHLDEQEAQDLVYLLEEEKLSRDVYLTSFERWQTLSPHGQRICRYVVSDRGEQVVGDGFSHPRGAVREAHRAEQLAALGEQAAAEYLRRA